MAAAAFIALCGLPGTGKSTLARALQARLDAAVLDKDAVRAALFAPTDVAYRREQDDLCCRALHAAAEFLVRAGRRRWIVFDGRTYGRREQVDELEALAARLGTPLHWVECTCAEEVARRRLEADTAAGGHAAGNRNSTLYRQLKASAEPIVRRKLVLRTDELGLDEQVQRVEAWLGAAS